MAKSIDLATVVAQYSAAHKKAMAKAGCPAPKVSDAEATGILSNIVDKLLALNIPWTTILKDFATILPMIFSGTSFEAIIAAILAALPTTAPA